MNNKYISINFNISPIYPGTEILIAEMSQLKFEMFEENDLGLIAYIKLEDFKIKLLDEISLLKSTEFKISYSISLIEDKNWNKEWENNFDSVEINDECVIRAPFHKAFHKKYEVVIMPQMSFGTGHHETTQLIIEYILESNLKKLTVSDIGCGTAILSILCEKKGALKVDAIDIDKRCYDNSIENLKRNKCEKVFVQNSSSECLTNNKYDLILCNINLNHLVDNFKNFTTISKSNTVLIISGFYKEDLDFVNIKLKNLNFYFKDFKEKNNWVSARYIYRKIID